jgi:glycosyltransferase involved in cell wall biosynthesis
LNKLKFPTLTIIVPSYNQADFLEETLLSIINQHYPALELIVIDGGSTDGSIEIIRKYADSIAYWVSEPDRGQSHAINKGLQRATGEWVAWMNSDDCYLRDTLVKFFSETPHTQYDFMHGLCTTGYTMEGRWYRQINRNDKKDAFRVLLFFMGTEFIIPSQSVFIRRNLIEKVGLLDETLHYVMDMEWFTRIFLVVKKSRRYFYNYAICFYRKQPQAKTTLGSAAMVAEAKQVALKYENRLSTWQKWALKQLLKEDDNFRQPFSRSKNLGDLILLIFKYPFHAVYSKKMHAHAFYILRTQLGFQSKPNKKTTFD